MQCTVFARQQITSLADWNTHLFGELLGRIIPEGTCIGLIGELGSGKTTFVQGLANGLEVPKTYTVASPTFTIVNIYPGRSKLAHIDLYRISTFEEFEGAGIAEFFSKPYIAAVEWFEKLEELGAPMPENLIVIRFEFNENNSQMRTITMEACSEHLAEIVDSFATANRS